MLLKLIKYRREIKKYTTSTRAEIALWKYYFRWMKTIGSEKNSLQIGLPWFTFQAIDFVSRKLPKNSTIFEYGGGGSTVYFLNLGHQVRTAEHHLGWFEMMLKQFKDQHNWEGIYCAADMKETQENLNASLPEHYYTTDEEYLGNIFKTYVTSINRFENETFDPVLVDGRSRPSCIEHSIAKIKSGGYLIVDNTEREYYLHEFGKRHAHNFELILNDFGPVPYVDWFNQTTVYKKK